MNREQVEATPRRPMTEARKRKIWEEHRGCCEECGKPVPMTGPGVVYDHIIQIWMGGSEDDTNVQPLHAMPCNAIKTAHDAAIRAKTKRLIANGNGTATPTRRPLQGRGFEGWRTFDGSIRRAAR